MPTNISGSHNDHYFHLHNDDTQMKTAQRATFLPTPGNKISNRFIESDNKFVRGAGRFMKKMRQADLGFRGTASKVKTGVQSFGVNQRANFEKWSVGDEQQKMEVEGRRLSSLDRLSQKAEIKELRLDYKKEISKAEPDMMDVAVDAYTTEFQQSLRSKGYVESGGLAQRSLPESNVGYVQSQQGHRVSTGYEQPSLVAPIVAGYASRQHDNGDAGVKRVIKRSPLYGAVAVANSAQLVKQGLYGAASAMTPGDGEMHETFLRRARQAGDMRRMNTSSLDGNVALAREFEAVNRERAAFVQERLEPRGYRPVGDGEVHPPEKTRFMARAFDPYVKKAIDEKMNAGGNDASPGEKTSRPWIQVVASTYAGIANIKSDISVRYHTNRTRFAEKDIAAGNQSAQTKRAHHEGKRFKALFLSETTRAAAQGTMPDKIAELRSARRKQELVQGDMPRDDHTGYYGEKAHSRVDEEEFPAFSDHDRLQYFAGLQAQREAQQIPSSLLQRQEPAVPAEHREYYADKADSEFSEDGFQPFNDTERLRNFAQLQEQRDVFQSSLSLPQWGTQQPESLMPAWGASGPEFFHEDAWREDAERHGGWGDEDLYTAGAVAPRVPLTHDQVLGQFYGSQASAFANAGSAAGFASPDAISLSEQGAGYIANGRPPADYHDDEEVSQPDDGDYQKLRSATDAWRS